ncbi:MAG: LOG family protein [Planctomycetaceae bacterium]|nr:LOG family protein [Planctomycetaceae bacterium]
MHPSLSHIVVPFTESFERQAILAKAQEEPLNDSRLQIASPTYEIAYLDQDYIQSDHARAIRMQLEMDKPEWFMQLAGIRSTVIVFGSARFVSPNRAQRLLTEANAHLAASPNCEKAKDAVAKAKCQMGTSIYYEQAREFARIVSKETQDGYPPDYKGPFDYVICTGGGPGIMEAANRGAHDVGAPSIGLNIKLPYEQMPNPYTSPHLCFQFHYFNARKLHFMLRAKALVCSPGGYGTLDELFEGLTLRQTERMQQIPIILLGEEFWKNCMNFEYLSETGVIDRSDLELFYMTDSPQDAWDVIKAFYR